MIAITSSALTHPGNVRKSNEDNMLVTGRVVAVADGLGGHAAGEVASKIAVDRMRELGDVDNLHPDQIIDAILDTNAAHPRRDARAPRQRRYGHHARPASGS